MKYNNYYDVFLFDNQQNKYSLEYILKEVSRVVDIPVEALKTPSRKRENTEARFAYFLLSMELTSKSLTKIGAIIPRHYASVLHAKKNAHLPSIKKIIKNTNLL